MNTTALSQSLLASADLSKLVDPTTILNQISHIDVPPLQLMEKMLLPNYPAKLSNPTFTGDSGIYTMTGSVSYKDSDNFNYNFNGAEIKTDTGKITVAGSYSGTDVYDGYSQAYKDKSISYEATDGRSKWTVVGGNTTSAKGKMYDDEGGTYSYSENYTSLSSSDANNNSVTFSGKLKQGNNDTGFSGYMTSMELHVGNTVMKATGLKLSHSDLTAFYEELYSSMNDFLLSTFFSGNDVLTITNDSTVHEINGYAGNDKITGSTHNDTIIGGAGSDTLTGGKGADTFSFKVSDFFAPGVFGGHAYIDTITDFNPADGDILTFGKYVNLANLSFYSSISEAKAHDASLFYTKGTIYLNEYKISLSEYEYDNSYFNATAIIKLTGNPKLNADGTDWAAADSLH